MEPAGKLRPQRVPSLPGLNPGRPLIPARICLFPGPASFRSLPSSISRRALSPASGEGTSAAPASDSAADVNHNSDHVEQHAQVSKQPPHKAEVTVDLMPTARAQSDGDERDWHPPPPGDWGGVVDPQSIKEPDSSGVWFFFILIAGLSLGVHQLLRFAGGRRPDESLVRSVGMPVVVVARDAHRGSPPPGLPASKPEATVEAPTVRSAADIASDSNGADKLTQRTPELHGEGAATAATQSNPGETALKKRMSGVAASSADEARQVTAHEDVPLAVSASEAAASEALESEEEAEARVQLQGRHEAPSPVSNPEAWIPTPSHTTHIARSTKGETSFTGKASQTDEVPGAQQQDASALLRQQEPQDRAETGDRVEPATSRFWFGVGPGARAEAAPPASEASKQGQVQWARDDSPDRISAPSTSADSAAPVSTAGAATAVARPLQASTGQANAGPLSTADGASLPGASRQRAPFASPGPTGFRGGDDPSTSTGDGGDAKSTSSVLSTGAEMRLDTAAPSSARLSLPAVRPEPLSRAPDSSALAHLPTDDSLSSLRERAQLALRAAAAASEASQRAAAYAAAASSAASRAAEAAERAAGAATLAQAGLESAAESAIVAAEARVAQAAEAAKEAEGRAASAAAHATAYQDMSQSQADIAERASNTAKPPAPGPLSQLHQLWRSASSAFTQGHQAPHSPQQHQQPSLRPSSLQPDSGSSVVVNESAVRSTADGGASPRRSSGGGAAESITTTVKGFLSWLGQGDGMPR